MQTTGLNPTAQLNSCKRHLNNFSQSNNGQMHFVSEILAKQLLYLNTLQVSLLVPIFHKCVEKLAICISQHFLLVVQISRRRGDAILMPSSIHTTFKENWFINVVFT